MKTIRLLYPDYLSGGLKTYYFGANLMKYILPYNSNQQLIEVPITPPNHHEVDYPIIDGIYAKNEVINGIKEADKILNREKPDKVITIGGSCIVSLAPFDYLKGVYNNIGIIWIDAHPDISVKENGYPYAHAMVLGALTGIGDQTLKACLKNKPFKPSDILYIGLQDLHQYQKNLLEEYHVDYKIQDNTFLSNNEIKNFTKKFDHVLIHLDIDVLDPNLFHSTYFANKKLVGDGGGGGKMDMSQLSNILKNIEKTTNIIGFTIAEYLPFDEENLSLMFSNLNIFK